MTWHGYLAIEDINLNQEQRETLWQAIKNQMGSDNLNPYPQFRNHWRFNNDVTKGIFEALFRDDQLSVDWFKEKLGIIFDFDPALIDHHIQQIIFDQRQTPIATFSRSGTNYIRFAAFGGLSATWPQSQLESLAYLLSNLAEWEIPE